MYQPLRMFLGVIVPLFCGVALLGDRVSSKPDYSKIRLASPTTPRDPAPFELVAQQFSKDDPQSDANCLLQNPQWGWQVSHPITGTPTTENFPDSIDVNQCNQDFDNCIGGQCDPKMQHCKPNQDLPPTLCPMCYLGQNNPQRIHGHYNWFPATYTGTVCFNNYSYPDLDYTFSFIPRGSAGLTRWNPPSEPDLKRPKQCGPRSDQTCSKPCGKNGDKVCEPKALHIEFDSIETIEKFQSKNWSDFRHWASPCETGPVHIRSCNGTEARKAVTKKRAVVIGLVGLDSEHNIFSELHPIYAIAIEMNDDLNDNTWMVFARNNGDEGACSIKQHPLFGAGVQQGPLAEVKLLIPPPLKEKVSGADLGSGTIFYSNNSTSPTATYFDKLFLNPNGPDFIRDNNQGVALTFNLTSCGAGCTPLIEGEVHINWQRAGSEPFLVELSARPILDACVNPDELEKEEEVKFKEPTPNQANQIRSLILEARSNGFATMSANRAGIDIQNSPPLATCTSLVDKIRPDNLLRMIEDSSTKRKYDRIEQILNRR